MHSNKSSSMTSITGEPGTMAFDPAIRYMVPVADGAPGDATPLQGFSLGLCQNVGLLSAIAYLPSSIYEPTELGLATSAARRICGANPINWLAMSPRAIRAVSLPAFLPFNVLLLPKEEDPADYRTWAQSCYIPPLIVADRGGDITHEEFDRHAVQRFCLNACQKLSEAIDPIARDEALEAIKEWREPVRRTIGYKIKGHNTVRPNLRVLSSLGFKEIFDGPLKEIDKLDIYVDQIAMTTRTILDERAKVDTSAGAASYPHTPDLNLFLPSIYPHVESMPAPQGLAREEQKRFVLVRNGLIRQSGYNYQIRTKEQMKAVFGFDEKRGPKQDPSPHPLTRIRQLELALATEAVALLAQSELSATIRLPNATNRTAGAVRQFATHYRSDETRSRKRLIAFRQVQAAIDASIPAKFKPLINASKDGIRIIADAPLEWMSVDGLPLCIRKNVSRLPATPGNLLIGEIGPLPLVHLTPADFREILVISALKRDDPIRGLFEMAFSGFAPDMRGRTNVRFTEVGNTDQLVAALNDFDGPLVIFDGHGSHKPGEPAVLHLQDQICNIWTLRDRLYRPPPIVILSACDTHAADRNHATTANGFLSIGSRAVLSSLFPLDARSAAIFAARLVFRISSFVPAAIGLFNRALTWTEIVSGMLRMQLLTDLLRLLLSEKLIDDATYVMVHQEGNLAINGLSPDDPFEKVLTLLEEHDVSRSVSASYLEIAIANSAVISYLNFGRPETIVIDDESKRAD